MRQLETVSMRTKLAFGIGASGEAGTLWTAYQAATYWSSHVDKTKGAVHTTKVNREDRVRKMLVSPQWMELEAA